MNVPKMIIYLIRDERSERYGTPIFTQLDADSLAESYRASIFANLKDAAPFLDSVLYQALKKKAELSQKIIDYIEYIIFIDATDEQKIKKLTDVYRKFNQELKK